MGAYEVVEAGAGAGDEGGGGARGGEGAVGEAVDC